MPQISNVISKLALASMFWSSLTIAALILLPLDHARTQFIEYVEAD